MTIDSSVPAWVAIAISIISLIISFVCFVLDYRLQKRSEKRDEQLANLQLRINEFQLQREEEEAKRRSSSKVEAHHVPIGLKAHRIKISNTGGTTVTNVTCTYDEDNGPCHFDQEKEPFERLEPGECFEEPVVFAPDSPHKFELETHWTGPDGQEHSFTNYITW